MNQSINIASIFLWIGFVCAISFMEAWLKFRAPNVTLPLGLGIGRLVFSALNKVEIILALIIILNIAWNGEQLTSQKLFLLVPFIMLFVQTIWLLPTLDARAELHIQGKEVAKSFHHLYYVGMEVIKVVFLFLFGISLLKSRI